MRRSVHRSPALSSTLLAWALGAAPLTARAEGGAEGPLTAEPPLEGPKVTPGVSSGAAGAPTSPVALDLWPGVGTSSLGRGQDRRALSLGLVSWSGSIEGADLSLLGSLVEAEVEGVQASGLAALSRGPVEGAQLGGALTRCGGDLEGIAGAGALAMVQGEVDGALVGGFGALSGGAVDGASLGGFVAMNGAVDGVQGSGFLSAARGPVDGVQASGFLNLAGEGLSGLQVGVINLTRGEVDGLMLGLVNVAEDAEAAVGLINILPKGRREVELGASESGAGHVIFKTGSRRIHNIFSGELRPRAEGGTWSAGVGMGLHQPVIGERVWADLDLVASHQSGLGQLHLGVSELGVARAMVGLQLNPRLSVTAGPTWSALLTAPRATVVAPPAPVPVVDTQTDQLRLRQWPGAQVGVQLHAPRRGD